jgi:hypothetical protein
VLGIGTAPPGAGVWGGSLGTGSLSWGLRTVAKRGPSTAEWEGGGEANKEVGKF